MSQIQYLRGILLFNNFIAGIIALVSETWWWNHAIWDVMGSFLLVSWLVNLITLALTLFLRRRSVKLGRGGTGGYSIISADDQESSLEDVNNDRAAEPLSHWLSLVVLVLDMVFVVAFAALFGIGVADTPNNEMTAAVIGCMVALVVHLFFVLYKLGKLRVYKYTIKISVERRRRGVSFGTLARGKEQRSSPTIQQQEEQQQQQQPPSPAYRGSPSNKTPQTPSPLKLVDPSESDSLMNDQE